MNIQELSKKYMIDKNKLNKMQKKGLFNNHQIDISYMNEILNLENIGLDYDQISDYLDMDDKKQIELLKRHRDNLLNHIHQEYKKIDLIDYLLNQKKEV